MQYLPSEAVSGRGASRGAVVRALLVVIGVEVGLLLLTLPWTPLWERNYWILHIASSHPAWLRLWLNSYSRGAVSGLGLVNLWFATSEITVFRR